MLEKGECAVGPETLLYGRRPDNVSRGTTTIVDLKKLERTRWSRITTRGVKKGTREWNIHFSWKKVDTNRETKTKPGCGREKAGHILFRKKGGGAADGQVQR